MTLTTQFITMLTMVGMGSVFGATLDTYSRFLNRTKRKRWIVFINDILFWIVQGLAIFYILFLVNRGELRFYIFIALLCGFAAYQSLFKNIYLRLLEVIISMVISIYRFLLKVLYYLIYKPVYSLVFFTISLLLLVCKGLFSLFKTILKAVLLITRVIFAPVKWLLYQLWNILPKRIKKIVEKLYNSMAGYFMHIKNYYNKLMNRWKKS